MAARGAALFTRAMDAMDAPETPAPPAPRPRPRPRTRRRRRAAPAAVAALLAFALLTGAGRGTEGWGSGEPASDAQRAAAAPQYFTGRAFDTCEAPPLSVMRAWRASPYRAVGVYFGGRGRGCRAQRQLTPGWVASVHGLGWRLLPLFVGSQAPCVLSEAKRRYAIGGTPWAQGTREAGDAVRAARALGFAAASPLYLDMEAYRLGDARCAATTLRFVRAWSREVRRLGYLPGFYSSAETGVRHLERERRAGTRDLPSVVWFARWRGVPTLAEAVLAAPAWWPHGRIHQYAGNVSEAYGGRRLLIDRSLVDAPVARVRP